MARFLKQRGMRWLGVLAVAVLTAGCAFGTQQSTASKTGPVKIGWSGPFTGSLQAMANTMNAAIKISSTEVNQKGGAGGRQIQLVVKDDALSPDTALAQAQQFVNQDRIELMMGPAVNTPFLPTRSTYAKAGISQFLVGTAANGVDLQNFPYVYRTFFSGDAEAEVLINFLYNVKHATKIAILVENTGSGLPGAASLQRAIGLNSNITLVTTQVFPSGEPNLTPYITAIQKSGANAIALWSVGGPNTAAVVKSMDEVKFYVPVAGDIGATFKATPALAGDALNRVELYGGAFKSELYATGSVPAGSVATFRDTVKSTMGVSVMSDSVHLAVMYYDTVYVIAQALNKTNGDTTAAVLKTALESGKFTTPLGDVYQFSSADHNGFGKENLSLAHITPTSFKDGFWEKADGAP